MKLALAVWVFLAVAFLCVAAVEETNDNSLATHHRDKRGFLSFLFGILNNVQGILQTVVQLPQSIQAVLSALQGSGLLSINPTSLANFLSMTVQSLSNPITFLTNFNGLFSNMTAVNATLVASVENGLTCAACTYVFSLFKIMLLLGFDESQCGDVIVAVCVGADLFAPPNICQGFVDNYKHMLFVSIQKTTLSMGDACGFLVPYNCFEDPSNWNITNFPGNKPALQTLPAPTIPTNPFQCVVIGDPHFDIYYLIDAFADCQQSLCCRSGNIANPANGVNQFKAGNWGSLEDCDTPNNTFITMLKSINANYQSTCNCVIWIGDIPAHDTWNNTGVKLNIDLAQYLVYTLKTYLPGWSIYPVMGNHDSFPANNFPPPGYTDQDKNVTLFYEMTWGVWSQVLPNTTAIQKSVNQSGSYSTVMDGTSLTLISINSQYCYDANFWLLINDTDPNGVLQFLATELLAVETAGTKALIVTHIPPCYEDCLGQWSLVFQQIVNRFEATVVATIAGHTHWDHFCILHDPPDEVGARPTNMVYTVPSTTTYTLLNMAYRSFNFDPVTYEVTDHNTYWMDMAAANSMPANTLPIWKQEYSARQAYSLPSLRPTDWQNAVNIMKANNTPAAQVQLNNFQAFYTRSSPYASNCTEKTCWNTLTCRMEMGTSRTLSCCDAGST